jgi:hypothetical protein
MTFKLLKRRYRSSDTDDKLRELEYFNHPYAKGSSIKLINDVELEESISLISLSSEFVAADNGKQGKKNGVNKEKEKDEDEDEDSLDFAFEPFDMNRQIYAAKK